jgi:hypothetical protein
MWSEVARKLLFNFTSLLMQELGSVLSAHRDKAVWFGVLPLIGAIAATAWFGAWILPEIAIFYLASSWSGLVLNQIANLLIRWYEANEWNFIKTAWILAIRQRDFGQLYTHFKETFRLLRNLLIEILLLSYFGRLGQFLNNCVQGFGIWLAVYGVIKITADQGLKHLNKIETPPQEDNLEDPSAPAPYCFKNIAWLTLYHGFTRTASEPVIERYKQLHDEVVHHDRNSLSRIN